LEENREMLYNLKEGHFGKAASFSEIQLFWGFLDLQFKAVNKLLLLVASIFQSKCIAYFLSQLTWVDSTLEL